MTQQATPVAQPTTVMTSVAPAITGTSYRAAITTMQAVSLSVTAPPNPTTNSTVNTSVATLPGNTPVNAVINGVSINTTAAEVSAINPSAQVAVPFSSAFVTSVKKNKGGIDRGRYNNSEHGTGKGGDNAHSHAFGGHGYGHDNTKSEGFGGGAHFH